MISAAQEDELGRLYLSNVDFLKNGVPASIIATLVRGVSCNRDVLTDVLLGSCHCWFHSHDSHRVCFHCWYLAWLTHTHFLFRL